MLSKALAKSRCNEAFRARVISYADDFVILSPGRAKQSLQCTQGAMGRLGLRLNNDKTVVRDARKEHFDLLGYTFDSVWFKKTGKPYMGACP